VSLWEIYQQSQIRAVSKSQVLAEQGNLLRDRRIEQRAEQVEDRLEQLGTLVEALWSVCRDRLGVSDDDLSAAVDAVLERDRAEAAAGPVRCACGAAISSELDKCQFCGTPSPRPVSPFRGL
jgi:hypothetical protein